MSRRCGCHTGIAALKSTTIQAVGYCEIMFLFIFRFSILISLIVTIKINNVALKFGERRRFSFGASKWCEIGNALKSHVALASEALRRKIWINLFKWKYGC